MSEKKAFPLFWPEGWKRSAPSTRTRAKFIRTTSSEHGRRSAGSISIADGAQRVLSELERMGFSDDDILISTNVVLRLDGLPRSDRGEPSDPGAAVYWNDGKGNTKCMAVDRYDRVADNLAAIAATLEALRAIERHGGGEILDRAFRGFAALPETTSGKSWRDILQFHPQQKVTRDEVKFAFRELAKQRHPDPGGSDEEFRELIWARDAAFAEIDQNSIARGA